MLLIRICTALLVGAFTGGTVGTLRSDGIITHPLFPYIGYPLAALFALYTFFHHRLVRRRS